jgi:hypothetical protein
MYLERWTEGMPKRPGMTTLDFVLNKGRAVECADEQTFAKVVYAALASLIPLKKSVGYPTLEKANYSYERPEGYDELLAERVILIADVRPMNSLIHRYYFTADEHLIHLQQAAVQGGVRSIVKGTAVIKPGYGGEVRCEAELSEMFKVLMTARYQTLAQTDPLLHVLLTLNRSLKAMRQERASAITALNTHIAPVSSMLGRYRTVVPVDDGFN